MGKQGKSRDQEIERALKHPLRRRLLRLVSQRPEDDPTTSPRQISEELDEPLSTVAYHVRVLRGAGLLRETKQAPARGAIQHFYRLDPERSQLPMVVQVLEEGVS